MENWEVAAALERMAGLLALKGEKDYKVRAYSRAARQAIRSPEPLLEMVKTGRLQQLPGIGKGLSAKIEELVTTGRSSFLTRLEEEVPPELLELFSIPGVGFKTAAVLVQGLGLENLAQLEKAAREGRVSRLPGLGKAVEENILTFFRERPTAPGGFHRGVAVPLAEQVVANLEGLPVTGRVQAAGQVRRGTELVSQVTVLVETAGEGAVAALKEALWRLPGITAVVPEEGGFSLDNITGLPLRIVPVVGENWAAALAEQTGSEAHWHGLVELARRKGLHLTREGLFRERRRLNLEDEAALYRALGLDCVPPELREGGDELEEAATGKLPHLLEHGDIRGDLHLHTDWSDGTAGIEEMAAAASERGYEYIAVTDHSPSLQIAGGLKPERLARQIEEIRRLNRQNRGCRILTGMEVDIRPDGTLDLPDDLLEELDVVIGSVHSHFRQSSEEMTARICRAMEHPALQIIGHPTGRLLGSRGAYRVDVDRLISRAAETGTILEINASPQRLDLPEIYLRRAREAGVLLAINTDAHSTVTMSDMGYGVTAARRGRLEAGDVVNTLPLPQLLEALQRKGRRKRGR